MQTAENSSFLTYLVLKLDEIDKYCSETAAFLNILSLNNVLGIILQIVYN